LIARHLESQAMSVSRLPHPFKPRGRRQEMKRIHGLALLMMIITSPVVFSQIRKVPQTKATTPIPQAKNKVRDEATDEANKVWEEYFLKCGDSYYSESPEVSTNLRHPICEYRFVSISLKELPISEPDKLNGITRRLTSQFAAKAGRCYAVYYYHDQPDKWGEWGEGIQLSSELIKKSGDWSAKTNFGFGGFFPPKHTKISCSNIPDGQARHSLNLDNYCRSKHGDAAVAVNTAGDAYSWRCKVDAGAGNTRYFEMNMDEACRGQYGSEFKAAFDNLKDSASWHCVPK
jgi:hypothetical protein